MRKWWVWIPVLLLFPGMAFASDPELPVEIRTAQGIKYYNGGVGLDERAALPQLYTLKLVLATDNGLLLNNAEVKILEAGKEVFSVRADNGPWLVADLPPGTYRVEATLEGRSASIGAIRIAAGAKKAATLSWKASEVDMGL